MANENSLIFDAIINDDYATFVHLLGRNEKEIAENAMRFNRNRQPVIRVGKLNVYDLSPFLLCAKYGRHKMLEFLLNIPGININQQDSCGHNALAQRIVQTQIAQTNKRKQVIELKNTVICTKLLLSQPLFNVNAIDSLNRSALELAAKDEKQYKIVTLLLKRINIWTHDKWGFTAIMRAAMHLNATNIRLLLRNAYPHPISYMYTYVNQTNQDSHTALLLFAYQDPGERGLQCARQLLTRGYVDVHYIGNRDANAMTITVERHKYLTQAMITHGRI
jgi:ankyrin repeat protein